MDYTDLLRDLREHGAHFVGDQFRMCRDAAAAIESLQAECERLRAELTNLQIAFNDWKVFHSTTRLEVECARLRAELAAAQSRLDAVREIYAGMDGFIPQTAPEAYCLRIIREMAHAAMTQEKRDE